MHTAVRVAMGVLGAVAFVFSLDLVRGLGHGSSIYTVAEGMEPGDFRSMFAAEVVLVLGSGVRVAGAVWDHHLLITVADALFAVLILVPITILVRWRRRFL